MGAFSLNAMTAKAHRSWDADIDRIVAKQQEKKRRTEMAALERAEPRAVIGVDQARVMAEVISGTFHNEDDVFVQRDRAPAQKAQTQNAQSSGAKKSGRRVAKRHRYVPAAFMTMPKFAVVTTSTILRLR